MLIYNLQVYEKKKAIEYRIKSVETITTDKKSILTNNHTTILLKVLPKNIYC